MTIIREFQKVKGICMYSNRINEFIEEVSEKFKFEFAICNVFDGRRWSFVSGTKNFINGRNRFMIDDNYGILVDCDDNELEIFRKFIELKKSDLYE